MIKKTILTLQLVLISLYSHGQESSIELPLIGDRLSGAVSQTEEEALGRQFFVLALNSTGHVRTTTHW